GFELGRVGEREAFQEVAAGEVRRSAELTRGGQGFEAIEIQLHRPGTEPYVGSIRMEAPRSQALPQRAQRHVQRTAGVMLRLVCPEKADQMVPGAASFRRAGEIYQEPEILSPREIGR